MPCVCVPRQATSPKGSPYKARSSPSAIADSSFGSYKPSAYTVFDNIQRPSGPLSLLRADRRPSPPAGLCRRAPEFSRGSTKRSAGPHVRAHVLRKGGKFFILSLKRAPDASAVSFSFSSPSPIIHRTDFSASPSCSEKVHVVTFDEHVEALPVHETPRREDDFHIADNVVGLPHFFTHNLRRARISKRLSGYARLRFLFRERRGR